jgi:hypothetical protein
MKPTQNIEFIEVLEFEEPILQTISISEVRESSTYINKLNKIIQNLKNIHGYASLKLLIDAVHSICPELKQYCDENKDKFHITSVTDKGLVGKIIEFYLFGNLPNSKSCPDTPYGDIKTTHFKECTKSNLNAFNAKERLTLTNFGDPDKEENIALISDKNSMKETKFYEKIKTGIILVLQHDKEVYDTIASVYNKKLIAIVLYNLDDIFEKHNDVAKTFQNDFDKIKKCIVEKNVSQCGQQYLHIHKHGCKNGVTRAFGFTSKFLTKLVSLYTNLPIITKGRSEYIEF